MISTPKERLQRVIRRQPVDHLPTQVNYTSSMGEKLAAHLGVSLSELPGRLGNSLRRVDLIYPARTSPDGKARFDWWGVGWSTETEGYWPVFCPLAESHDLDAFPWPDLEAPDLLDEAAQTITGDGGQHFVVPNLGFALFERAWLLRGFEQFNLDMALDPGYAAELLERITAVQEKLARRFLALGVDGGYFGDDYGTQTRLLFSPRTWRALIKPRLRRLFAVFREAGRPVILHSDGEISVILPDLGEIGLTMLNPVQPEVLDLQNLHDRFGDQLAFYGGISTQTVLPFGSPAEVRHAAQEAVRLLAPTGTGLLLAPSHRLTADIPLENVDAMLAYFAELGAQNSEFRTSSSELGGDRAAR